MSTENEVYSASELSINLNELHTESCQHFSDFSQKKNTREEDFLVPYHVHLACYENSAELNDFQIDQFYEIKCQQVLYDYLYFKYRCLQLRIMLIHKVFEIINNQSDSLSKTSNQSKKLEILQNILSKSDQYQIRHKMLIEHRNTLLRYYHPDKIASVISTLQTLADELSYNNNINNLCGLLGKTAKNLVSDYQSIVKSLIQKTDSECEGDSTINYDFASMNILDILTIIEDSKDLFESNFEKFSISVFDSGAHITSQKDLIIKSIYMFIQSGYSSEERMNEHANHAARLQKEQTLLHEKSKYAHTINKIKTENQQMERDIEEKEKKIVELEEKLSRLNSARR